MFNNNGDFKYEVNPEFDFIIEEVGDRFMALRKIKWGDSENYKLDLRRYRSSEEGERMEKGKGLSFMTEEGPNELTRILLDQGYGNADEIAEVIKTSRPDIAEALENEDELIDIKEAI